MAKKYETELTAKEYCNCQHESEESILGHHELCYYRIYKERAILLVSLGKLKEEVEKAHQMADHWKAMYMNGVDDKYKEEDAKIKIVVPKYSVSYGLLVRSCTIFEKVKEFLKDSLKGIIWASAFAMLATILYVFFKVI